MVETANLKMWEVFYSREWNYKILRFYTHALNLKKVEVGREMNFHDWRGELTPKTKDIYYW